MSLCRLFHNSFCREPNKFVLLMCSLILFPPPFVCFCKRRKNASWECRTGRFRGSRVLLMLDARSADYIPSKATLGHSQGHSILCPIQLYTIPYTTLYNSIQPRLMSLIRPPPPTSPSSPDRFLFLHFNAPLLWQAGRPFMWSWYFIILARQTLWFNYFIFLFQRPWHRS